ncbi:MAG: hypothetical protein Q8R79_08475, partial [Legionellaceae bacterium]|nr:hypothetical protein [Legionellaceae bacterium]
LSEDIVFDYMCCQEEAKQDSSLKAPCFRDMMEYADDVLKGVAAAPTQFFYEAKNGEIIDESKPQSPISKNTKKNAVPKMNIPVPETLEGLQTALCGLLQAYLNKRVSHIDDDNIEISLRTLFFRNTSVTREKARDVHTLQKNIKAAKSSAGLMAILEKALVKNTELQESICHLPFMKSGLAQTLEIAKVLCDKFEKQPVTVKIVAQNKNPAAPG